MKKQQLGSVLDDVKARLCEVDKKLDEVAKVIESALGEQVDLEDEKKKLTALVAALEPVMTLAADEQQLPAKVIQEETVQKKAVGEEEQPNNSGITELTVLKGTESIVGHKGPREFKPGELTRHISAALSRAHKAMTPVEILSDIRKVSGKTTSVPSVDTTLRGMLRRNEVINVHGKWMAATK